MFCYCYNNVLPIPVSTGGRPAHPPFLFESEFSNFSRATGSRDVIDVLLNTLAKSQRRTSAGR